MYTSAGSNYRDNILRYFENKDPVIRKILLSRLSDWRYPFESAYRLHHDTVEEVDILSFLLAVSVFNKNKSPIREKTSLKTPIRGEKFINRLIKENRVKDTIAGFFVSVYISEKILNKVVDYDFNWMIKSPTEVSGNPRVSEFIIVDLPNIYYKIKEYIGTNNSLKYFKDKIIGDRQLCECKSDMISHITDYDFLNGNLYKYIFISPCSAKEKDFDELYYVINVDCKEYIGEKCSDATLSNQVDDTLLLMLYDYCEKNYNCKISILSGDNYDFSVIAQDFSNPLRRAWFSMINNLLL